jgi:hypothetical protein
LARVPICSASCPSVVSWATSKLSVVASWQTANTRFDRDRAAETIIETMAEFLQQGGS